MRSELLGDFHCNMKLLLFISLFIFLAVIFLGYLSSEILGHLSRDPVKMVQTDGLSAVKGAYYKWYSPMD
jgi:hypothetical protein